MAEIMWTVVTRKNGRGQFQKTGFEGTWQEATAEGNRLYEEANGALEVWSATTTDTSILVDSGRRVTIAPTKAEREAAKAQAAKVKAAADGMLDHWYVSQHVETTAAQVLGVVAGQRDAAYALAEAGWDARAVARRLS